jgi:hypothetical protein
MIRLALTLALLPAHPLGNFSVNQLVSLTLRPDRVEAVAIVDLAELPTLQFAPDCDAVARSVTVKVDGERLKWTVTPGALEHQPGAAGLETTRLTCSLTAPANVARARNVDVDNAYQAERLGWHELTAHGIGIGVAGLPSANRSNDLRVYPADLLSSPLDVRTARLTITPGSTVDSSVAAAPSDRTSLPALTRGGRHALAATSRRSSGSWPYFSRSSSAPRTLPCPATARRSWRSTSRAVLAAVATRSGSARPSPRRTPAACSS